MFQIDNLFSGQILFNTTWVDSDVKLLAHNTLKLKNYGEMSSEDIFKVVGITIIVLLLLKYWVDWCFKGNKRIRLQTMQNNLLIELCKKQGVSTEMNTV